MKRHAPDTLSLVFGAVFVAIAGWWLASRYVDVDIPNFGWFAAAGLVVVGLLGIVASLRRERSDAAWTDPARVGPTPADSSATASHPPVDDAPTTQ